MIVDGFAWLHSAGLISDLLRPSTDCSQMGLGLQSRVKRGQVPCHSSESCPCTGEHCGAVHYCIAG